MEKDIASCKVTIGKCFFRPVPMGVCPYRPKNDFLSVSAGAVQFQVPEIQECEAVVIEP